MTFSSGNSSSNGAPLFLWRKCPGCGQSTPSWWLEDARFFEHRGIDYWRILGATFRNIEALEVVQGGSTITQQIAKSFFLTPERSYTRKIKEAILAQRIESYLSKNEILFLYLNQIYLGEGAYGAGAAAKIYFGKPVENLTLAECAMMAGLPPAPNSLSPFRNPKKARERQIYVLNRMLEKQMITPVQAIRAQAEEIRLRPKGLRGNDAPYFLEMVRQHVEEKYGKDLLYKGGLKIYTTINAQMQASAQTAVLKGLEEYEGRGKKNKDRAQVQGALIAMDPQTGFILALVGGRDFSASQFNRATQAKRQAGSAFKPIVHAAALDKGFTPATILGTNRLPMWTSRAKNPGNPRISTGSSGARSPCEKRWLYSRNLPTVKIAQAIGLDLATRATSSGSRTGPSARPRSPSAWRCSSPPTRWSAATSCPAAEPGRGTATAG